MTSSSFPSSSKDWKSVFIRNLAAALAARDDIELSLWSPGGEMPPGIRYVALPDEQKWLDTMAEQGGMASALRRNPVRGLLQAVALARLLRRVYRREPHADIVHANWLQLAAPLPFDSRPLLVTALGSDMSLLKIPGLSSLLRRQFSSRPTIICPNSDWMVESLRKRFGDVARIQCVPFGIDEDYFYIRRGKCAPPYKWLCVSRITPGKIGRLFEWGEAAFRDPVRELHLIGPMQGQVQIPEWVHYHGPASQQELLTRWFPEAAGLISLSQHPEGRPQVMLEAMAAGLPIVASNLPAHRDIIDSTHAGFICREHAELAGLLTRAENATSRSDMQEAARNQARVRFGGWDKVAERYVDAYKSLFAQ